MSVSVRSSDAMCRSSLALAVFPSERGTEAIIQAALGPSQSVVVVATVGGLLAAARSQRIGGVLIEPSMRGIAPLAQFVQRLREAYPSLPILLYCRPDAAGIRCAVALARAGADDVVLRGIDDIGTIIRRAMISGERARLAADVLEEMRPYIGPGAVPLVSFCLTHADHALSVADVARGLGVHRKTLVNRAKAARLPTPRALISWCRLVHAATLLQERGRSVEQIALSLGFGSGTALRNMFQRHVGLRPTEVHARGSHHYVIRVLCERLRQRAGTHHRCESSWLGGVADP